ncbi:type I-E CRISPR-associated endoribonuclease Cas2e [Streptomyces sp. NPDC058374]|uniref:type I-E CRISPR-associated endoribonuclease Cas2e n=1 Tax=Streptomyces sp. NPDC058374 TaxID=3346466 RepID=UPI0036564BE9
MPNMTVISATAVPAHLRGALSRWLLEITPSLYIGTISAKVREELWNRTTASITDGNAVLAYPSSSEQGYTVRTAGPQRRSPVDFEGLVLMAFKDTERSKETAKSG